MAAAMATTDGLDRRQDPTPPPSLVGERPGRCIRRLSSQSPTQTSQMSGWDLKWAVEKENVLEVERLLKERIDLNEPFANGWTVLHWACSQGNATIIEMLVTEGAGLTAVTDDGEIPMDFCKSTDARRAINLGKLWRAAHTGNVESVESLLEICDQNEPNQEGKTALYFASRCGHVGVVDLLLAHNADPDIKNKRGQAPLHGAARHGRYEVVHALLTAGADVQTQTNGLYCPLHHAAIAGDRPVLAELLAARSVVNAQTKGGFTALHLAARRGHLAVTQGLIDAGADVHLPDAHGFTALHKAAEHGHVGVVDKLLTANAVVGTPTNDASTSLHLAALHNHKFVIDILTKARADVNAPFIDGRTPLHLAALGGHLLSVDALLLAKADVNLPALNGATALHDAAEKGHQDIVTKLLSAGANIAARNKAAKTARQVTRNPDVRRVLDSAMFSQKDNKKVPMDRLKLFVCGHGKVGKSTLVRALQRTNFSARVRNLPPPVDRDHHGFAVIEADLPKAGNCSIWDFSGQPEHWLPHQLLMASASAVFLVACDLSDSVEVQLTQLRFWLRFIASRAQPDTPPRVAIVGTHRGAAKMLRTRLREHFTELVGTEHVEIVARTQRLDQIKALDGRWTSTAVEEAVASLHEEFADLLDLAPRIFYIESEGLEPTDRKEMTRLRSWILGRFTEIRAARLVPQVFFDVERLLLQCRRVLPTVAPFRDVLKELGRASNGKIDLSEERFRSILVHLTKAGFVMCFEDVYDDVVLDPSVFGKHIIGQLFCPGDSGVIVKHEDKYLFRRSSLEKALVKTKLRLGDFAHILQILVELELIFPWTVLAGLPWEVPPDVSDPLFAIPGRLCQAPSGQRVPEYHQRPQDAWKEPLHGAGNRWTYLGVRLDITNSQLMVPPSAFPRLQSQLWQHRGFRMWRNGVTTCTNDTMYGKIEVESLVEMHDSLQWIDVCVRSGLGLEKKCVQLLVELVTMCERLGAQLRATVIPDDTVRCGNVGNARRIDSPGASQQTADDARRQLPSQWLRSIYTRILNPIAIYFDRPPPGPNVICISYATPQKDIMWQVAFALAEHGFKVVNRDQINAGEEEDTIYFDEYLAVCKVGLVMLSDEYFVSRHRGDELTMMFEENKRIIPLKVASFKKPPICLDRMLGDHIPMGRGASAETFTDAFECNIRLLIRALKDAGVHEGDDDEPGGGGGAPPPEPAAGAKGGDACTAIAKILEAGPEESDVPPPLELRHPRFFARPPAGSRVIVMSYASQTKDPMWQVANALKDRFGYAVFNGGQILGGEQWDEIYFNEYLSECKVGLVLLSDAYFASRPCKDELRMMYSQEKAIIPIKVAAFEKPPISFVRMLGNHIPMCDRSTQDVFADAFDENIQDLHEAIERGLHTAIEDLSRFNDNRGGYSQ